MKKIDQLLIKSFIAPFLMTFGIALFVLIMQFLWKYIDDIVGKGLETLIILELIFYMSMSLVPMALPIAVLISSVMVMGNLGERYELASMKSAGLPLLRIMTPLFFCTFIVASFSFYLSNSLIPIANLKFKSRLFDITHQRPALNLEASTFNDDFDGFIIHIGEKAKNNKDIEDVKIYDHTSKRGNDNQIIAKRGEMLSTADKQYLIMKLYEGNQYQELRPSNRKEAEKKPHIRTSFKSWEKIFDLNQFSLERRDEDVFKNHRSMLSASQLVDAIDSIEDKSISRNVRLREQIAPFFFYNKYKDKDSTFTQISIDADTLKKFTQLIARADRQLAYQKAMSLSRSVSSYAKSAANDQKYFRLSLVKYNIELHRKFVMAMACILLLFIGAPMGAIIRKGGFGWPILVSICFFMLFIVLLIAGEKMARKFVFDAWVGAWLPCLVLAPIGMFLTYKAMTDSKLFNWDNYKAFFERLYQSIVKRKNNTNS